MSYSIDSSESVLEINAESWGECSAVFPLQCKNQNPTFIFFLCHQLTPNFVAGDLLTGWVQTLSPQSGRQHTVTRLIWEHCQVTAEKKWLAQSCAAAFKYSLVTFNPQRNQNTNQLRNASLLSSHHALLTAFQETADHLKLTDYLNSWSESHPEAQGLMLCHIMCKLLWLWQLGENHIQVFACVKPSMKLFMKSKSECRD